MKKFSAKKLIPTRTRRAPSHLMKRIATLCAAEPPYPECPKCHFEGVENLYSAIPRWLACPKCGHMWSNRTPYGEADRFRLLLAVER